MKNRNLRLGADKIFKYYSILFLFNVSIILLLTFEDIKWRIFILFLCVLYLLIILLFYFEGNHCFSTYGVEVRELNNYEKVFYKNIPLIIISVSNYRTKYRYIKTGYRYIGKKPNMNISYINRIPYPWISLSRKYVKISNIVNKEYSRSYIDRYLFDGGNYIYSFICKDKKNIDILLKNYPGKYCITLSFLRYQLDKVIEVIEEYNIDKSRIEIIEDENMYPEYTRFTVEDVKEFFDK